MKTPTEHVEVVRFSRQEFLERFWHYTPGEHVTFLAPTQNGKTTFMFDLLGHTKWDREFRGIKPHPPVVLVMKPRDQVVEKGIKKLGYKKVRAWPPVPNLFSGKPKGFALWPPHSADLDADDERLESEFRKCIRFCYRQGNRIIAADETYGLVSELNLGKDVTRVHTRGAGMGVGIWCLTQKPTHIGTWAYSQAEHLFVGYDPDERARDRFKEIGGVNPDIVKHEAARLRDFEWLYIRRTGRRMCIVEAN